MSPVAWRGANRISAIASCLFATMLALAGCVKNLQSRSPRVTGYIVVGVHGAQATGLSAGDTAHEMEREQVPQELRVATTSFVSEDGFDAACSRYFAARGQIIVLLNRFCDGSTVAVFDARVVILFDANRQRPNKYIWRSDEDFIGPVPPSRRQPMHN